MYLEMAQEWCAGLFRRVWRRGVMRSGMMTGLILALLVGVLSFAYRERGRGNIKKLKAKIGTDREDIAVPRPGGQEAIELTRMRLDGRHDAGVYFGDDAAWPGDERAAVGAYIPGKGEVNLMDSPSIEGAASAMTGTGEDADGQASLAMGGAFKAPWDGRIGGVASQVAAGRVSSVWRGHTMTLPGGSGGVARDGLLLARCGGLHGYDGAARWGTGAGCLPCR